MSSIKRHLSQDQQMIMVEFLEKHPDLICGRAKLHGKMLWHVLAKKLNAVDGGVRRPSRLWAKSWFDKKSTLKKLIMKYSMERRRGMRVSRMKWSSLDLRIIRMLIETGELKSRDIDMDYIEKVCDMEKAINEPKVITTKIEQFEVEEESLPSHASSPTIPDNRENSDDGFENVEFLETGDTIQNNLEGKDAKPITITNHQRGSSDPLNVEWNRLASLEEQRIQIEQTSCQARQDSTEALKQCCSAIESLAQVMKYQSTALSEAIKIQGDTIADALRAQGKMIAEALAKR